MTEKIQKKSSTGFKNKIVFAVVAAVVRFFLWLLMGLRINTNPTVRSWKKSKTPFIVLCAHPSEFDAVVLLSACFPRYTRFVAGAQQLYKGFQGKMLRLMGVIPKKQFVPDIFAIKEMMKTIKSGYLLGMMPEGRVSMDGTPNPNDMATAKLIKKLGVPVAILIPHGTYFVKPSYNYKGLKLGKISADFECLFTKEELCILSEDEILEKLTSRCSYNASEELRSSKKRYGSKKNLPLSAVSNILYLCPSCSKLYTLSDDGKTLCCENCGEKADLGFEGFIENSASWPDNIPQWNQKQLDFEHDFWTSEAAALSFDVKKSMLTLGAQTDYEDCADGTLTLSKNRFLYEDEFEKIELTLDKIAGVSADYDRGFITYYQGNEIRRFTVANKKYVARFVNSLMVLKGLK